MLILKNINLLIAFLLEVCMVISYGYWGFHLHANNLVKGIVGVVAPLAIVALWGFFAAPNSSTQLHQPLLTIFQFSIFFVAAALLYFSRQPLFASILLITWIVSTTLAIVWRQ